MSDIFSLKWNDYQSNWNKALNELRKDNDLTDITLISDDKVKFSAHKVLLSSCSNLFKFILKSSAQENPLLYLCGVNSTNLGLILDYVYYGEVNIYQEQLDSFLESAQMLEIQGLKGDKEDKPDNFNEEPEQDIRHMKTKYSAQVDDKTLVGMDNAGKTIKTKFSRSSSMDVKKIDVKTMTSEDIDKKMRELYEKTEKGWRCMACGHTTSGRVSSNIRQHVETHLNGLVYTCGICNKEFRTSPSLNQHKGKYHKNKLQ